jgi:hypothetical protein
MYNFRIKIGNVQMMYCPVDITAYYFLNGIIGGNNSYIETSIDVYDSRIKSEMFKGSIKLNLEFGTIILSLYLSIPREVIVFLYTSYFPDNSR